MATIDELETKVRYLESESEGEKLVTRHVLEQCRRNGAEVSAARVEISTIGLRLDTMSSDVIEARAALRNHGTLLSLLQRDVGALRNDVTALRRGQEELHVRMDGIEARIDRIEARLDTEFAEVKRKLDVLIAAVTPRDPA
jgi:chromosome segregation ATPase